MENNNDKQGKLKSTDIFGLINIINKIDVMKDIKLLARENSKLQIEKSKLLDKVSVAHFDEIRALEKDLEAKGHITSDINDKLLERVLELIKTDPEIERKIEEININLSSWKFDLIQIIISNLGRAEKDIYSCLSKFSGMDEEKFKEDPILLMSVIGEVFEDPNLSKLYDLMTKFKMI